MKILVNLNFYNLKNLLSLLFPSRIPIMKKFLSVSVLLALTVFISACEKRTKPPLQDLMPESVQNSDLQNFEEDKE